jgi:hypothetical protein
MQSEFRPRFTRTAAAVDPFCVWAVALWLPTFRYRTLSEMILRRFRVLVEIGDTMRILCCLLLLWSVLISGCGESKEDAVVPIKKSSETVTFDEQPKAANESQDAAVAPTKKPGDTVTLDEQPKTAKELQDAAVAAIKKSSGTSSSSETTQTTNNLQDAAVEAIQKLGGKVFCDEDDPSKPFGVNFLGLTVTDAELVNLKGMTSLQILILGHTKVTDAGLVHLKELTNLEDLYLDSIKVTDAGLVHLKGLTNLEDLWLNDTKVTTVGVEDLQVALSDCKISK